MKLEFNILTTFIIVALILSISYTYAILISPQNIVILEKGFFNDMANPNQYGIVNKDGNLTLVYFPFFNNDEYIVVPSDKVNEVLSGNALYANDNGTHFFTDVPGFDNIITDQYQYRADNGDMMKDPSGEQSSYNP